MEGEKFYITTPIYYINDRPHIGHAATTIVADVLARFHRQKGEDVLFLTGTDENGQKIVNAAKKNNEGVQAYVDRFAAEWEALWAKLGISNTDFIRTTEPRHLETVKDFWNRVHAAGDIYLGTYEGWYCTACEEFKKEDELVDGLCPIHKTEPERVKEQNYFFRLSKYQKPLLELYENNPDFVVPEGRLNEIRAFVERGLEDLSISREGKDWGIPVPDDENQRIYVWFDALINYISAVGIDWWEQHPADLHLMAKEITRFHAVIWPAMLLSAGLPVPRQIAAHGFFTAEGAKMSKTLGNVIDPVVMVDRYGNEAFRYYLLRELSFSSDSDFSEARLKERYNTELANGLGNFAARVLTLAEKEEFGPDEIDPEFSKQIESMKRSVREKTEQFRFHEALAAVWEALAFGDRYVNEKKVWAITDANERRHALLNLLALLDNVAFVLQPYLPEASHKITSALTWEGNTLRAKKIDSLFPRLA